MEIQSIEVNTKSISIPDQSVNNKDYTKFDFSRFTSLEELAIGNNSFENVNRFNIDGLNKLKSLKIGKNSFTHLKTDKKHESIESDPNRSFQVMNCAELKSIDIGCGSFSDYAGQYELKNLGELVSLKIGEIGSDSSNFYNSSFVVKGSTDESS